MSVRLFGPPRGTRGLSRRRIAALAQALLAAQGSADVELSLSLVDDAAVAKLNRRWRGRAGATDVLSFSLLEGAHARQRGALLGDVVIAVGVARRQAREHGHTLEAECTRLLIHGVLHLFGYDHERPRDARTMQAAERRLWHQLTAPQAQRAVSHRRTKSRPQAQRAVRRSRAEPTGPQRAVRRSRAEPTGPQRAVSASAARSEGEARADFPGSRTKSSSSP